MDSPIDSHTTILNPYCHLVPQVSLLVVGLEVPILFCGNLNDFGVGILIEWIQIISFT